MNQNTIQQSNLLDIIFENRNKEYGAYTLRKSYNSRMRLSLFIMAGLSFLFCLFVFKNSTTVVNLPNPGIPVPDQKVSRFQQPSGPAHKVAVNITHPKKTIETDRSPKIVDSININKLPATPPGTTSSLSVTSASAINFPLEGEDGNNKPTVNEGLPAAPVIKVNKPGPLDVADIMPQYPGGITALLDFLKKNLHAPEDVEEGNEVSVQIKFVVNYNGKPESFDVVRSGGIAFDNEVIRVLKKMPLWIPGKSNGENVSVYYVVPVKFTSEF